MNAGRSAEWSVSVRRAGLRLRRFSRSALGTAVGGGRAQGLATLRELAHLLWPIAAGLLGDTLLGLVDTKLVGGLGPAALGGVGIATALMFLNYSLIYGLVRIVKVRTAYAVGEDRPEDGVRYAIAGALLGGGVGAVVWLLGRDVTGLLTLLRLDPALVPYGRDFFAAVTYGAPAAGAMLALVNHRQAIGDSRTPMIVGMGGNVVNAALAYGLIYGKWGLPRLGVAGSGYATAMTQCLGFASMTALLARDAARSKAKSALPLRQAARELLGLGIPGGLQMAGELLAFNAFTAILGSIGAAEIAAHQIALVTIRTSFLPGIAAGEASCILVGRALGRRNLSEADRAHRAAIVLAVAFMASCGVVFGLFGGSIARAFSTDPEVVDITRKLLLVAAAFQVMDAFNVVLRGSLRGAEDVRVPAILGIGIIWTCVPTAAYFLGRLAGWGALGGWCGFIAETVLATVLFGRRWSHGGWRRKYGSKVEPDVPIGAVVSS